MLWGALAGWKYLWEAGNASLCLGESPGEFSLSPGTLKCWSFEWDESGSVKTIILWLVMLLTAFNPSTGSICCN